MPHRIKKSSNKNLTKCHVILIFCLRIKIIVSLDFVLLRPSNTGKETLSTLSFDFVFSFPLHPISVTEPHLPSINVKHDHNRYSASRGAHLNLKRAENARVLVSKIPGKRRRS
ncbi:hypothetical protein YC2023_071194 [Brassica napus]